MKAIRSSLPALVLPQIETGVKPADEGTRELRLQVDAKVVGVFDRAKLDFGLKSDEAVLRFLIDTACDSLTFS